MIHLRRRMKHIPSSWYSWSSYDSAEEHCLGVFLRLFIGSHPHFSPQLAWLWCFKWYWPLNASIRCISIWYDYLTKLTNCTSSCASWSLHSLKLVSDTSVSDTASVGVTKSTCVKPSKSSREVIICGDNLEQHMYNLTYWWGSFSLTITANEGNYLVTTYISLNVHSVPLHFGSLLVKGYVRFRELCSLGCFWSFFG